jgi:hypothetical protein
MISQNNFTIISSHNDTITPAGYNIILDQSCDGMEESYVCLPQPGAGLRFCLVSPADFSKLHSTNKGLELKQVNGVRMLTGFSETGSVSSSPYPVVSQWLIDAQDLHDTQIHFRMMALVADVYGPGFGDRGKAS